MYRTLAANMHRLAMTIVSVVHNMNPKMICMCEVGEVANPLSEEQMHELKNQVTRTWKETATEHIHLCCMFTTGEPYMTIYIDGPIRCTDHRILHNLYYAGGLTRTAQAFLCSFPGGESTEVINVHAPSGRLTLKDPQRQKLLTNLLKSNSISSPGRTTGGTIRWNPPARVTT